MTPGLDKVVVIKMNTSREEVWRYDGRIIDQNPHSLLIEAFFNIDNRAFHGVTLKRNDRSIERFYDNRWYNIFEIHARENDRLKAWYCNVTRPAEFSPGRIVYVDLALDVLVYPDGEYLILDRDEFEDLALDTGTRQNALAALEELVEMAEKKTIPDIIK